MEVTLWQVDGQFYQVTVSANEDLSEEEPKELDEMAPSLKLYS